MNEQLISFETAKLAQLKGFDIKTYPIQYYIFEYKGEIISRDSFCNSSYVTSYLQPTQSLLQKWLREVYGIQIEITHYDVMYDIEQIGDEIWHYMVRVSCYPMSNTRSSFVKSEFVKYEEALEAGLFEALKLI